MNSSATPTPRRARPARQLHTTFQVLLLLSVLALAATAWARTRMDSPGGAPDRAQVHSGEDSSPGDMSSRGTGPVRGPLAAGAMTATAGLPFSSVAYPT